MNRVYPTLVRRELWEHRWLWLAPFVAAGLFLALTIFGAVMASSHVGEFRMPRGSGFPTNGAGTPSASPMFMGVVGVTTQLFMISALVVLFYLLDCLYAERKDRSILFWKSLPVSDFQTVISKFGLAMLIPPLASFAAATVLYPIVYAIGAASLPEFNAALGGWNFADWLRAEGYVLACMLVTMLWYAPLMAWFMLASVFSSRSPYLIATLPIVVLGICEGLVLHSGNVWRFAGWRMTPIFKPLDGLERPGLWIGLAVAAGMLYIVIRLRRYRDDT